MQLLVLILFVFNPGDLYYLGYKIIIIIMIIIIMTAFVERRGVRRCIGSARGTQRNATDRYARVNCK